MTRTFDRRALLAAASLTLLAPRGVQAAPARKRRDLELTARDLALRPGLPPTVAWRFSGDEPPRLNQGDVVDVTISNRLLEPVLMQWRGLDGEAGLQPPARGAIPAGGGATYALTLTQAGTLICDARLGNRSALPLPLLPIIVAENPAVEVDRDAVLLIEDWRWRPDGRALPPGVDSAATQAVYTVNGQPRLSLQGQPLERLRLRIINGAHRAVIAVQLDGIEVRVMAIDSQPSEPFLARDGRLVMAPGTRIDALVDLGFNGARHAITVDDGERRATVGEIKVNGAPQRPQALLATPAWASNGLPDRLPLQAALRVDINLAGPDWMTASATFEFAAPAFRVKPGRAVVLALRNSGAAPMVFRLNGHHMRLLDRLDDGWKPFWLDTLAVPANQTVRVAFAASHPGAYLLEAVGTAWNSPTWLRHYLVEI